MFQLYLFLFLQPTCNPPASYLFFISKYNQNSTISHHPYFYYSGPNSYFVFLGYCLSLLSNSFIPTLAYIPFIIDTTYFQYNFYNNLFIAWIRLYSYSAEKLSSRFIFHSDKSQSLSTRTFMFSVTNAFCLASLLELSYFNFSVPSTLTSLLFFVPICQIHSYFRIFALALYFTWNYFIQILINQDFPFLQIFAQNHLLNVTYFDKNYLTFLTVSFYWNFLTNKNFDMLLQYEWNLRILC